MPYVVCAKWTASEGEEDELWEAARKWIGPTRQEPGNIMYVVHRDPENPRSALLLRAVPRRRRPSRRTATREHFQQYAVGVAIPLLDDARGRLLRDRGRVRKGHGALLAALFLAAISLRPQLVGVGSLLPSIQDDLDVPHSVAGLLSTIVVASMGVFAPLSFAVGRRLGQRHAIALSLALIAVFGSRARSCPGRRSSCS